jgi:CubicO group peptidase (beta-lactamase class C family)
MSEKSMKITSCVRCLLVGSLLLIAGFSGPAQNTFTQGEADSISAFLRQEFDGRKECMVIGLVDEERSQVFSGGQLDNGTTNQVDGNSVFFIGSVSKTFTALLLQAMADSGEVSLNDPVAKYLPKSVRMPTHGDKEITLLHLATHTAGFPANPNNMSGADVKEQYETYTVKKMYEYLSEFTLTREPGTEYEYSNLGMSLLGHVLALKSGTNFESGINRICRPLHMENTRIVPTPEMKAHLAMGHDDTGKLSPPWNLDAYAPAGAVHSTANDLLKYAAAQVGLTTSCLTSSIAKTHVIQYTNCRARPGHQEPSEFFGNTALPWMDRGFSRPGMALLAHAGGAGSYHAWVGFDTKQRRGVVVLTTSDRYTVEQVGQAALGRLPFRENVLENTREPVGIGAELELDAATHALRIRGILPDSPAARSGLSAGLIIQKIDAVDTTNKTVAECANLIRGKADTTVRLELVDRERHTTNTVELIRQKVIIAKR